MHERELTIDFRVVYHTSVSEIGKSIPWVEAYYLMEHLGSTPGTQTHTILSGWEYAADVKENLLMDILDIIANQNRAKNAPFKPVHERPNAPKPQVIAGTAVSLEEAMEIY